MNTEKLSERLATVAKYVPKGSRLADIGSDHAYLPCYLVKQEMITFAIAGEVAEGPFQSALKQVNQVGLTGRIAVRKGDGLEVVEAGEVNCITIAGMGGGLITSILEKGKDKLTEVTTLVLQPNIGAAAVRKWLLENQWRLVAESILKEDGKIYEILVAEKGDAKAAYSDAIEAEVLFGPFLMTEKNPAFLEKWTIELKNWRRILSQLDQADASGPTLEKKREIERKIEMAEEVLK